MTNINTKNYWEKRFSSGDWETKKGRNQTVDFATSQIQYIKISEDMDGVILDFGCGLGDAMPIYKKAFPKAKLIGVDISEKAISLCKKKYGGIANFINGEFSEVPIVDVIISSNTFEHLSDDKTIITALLERCNELFVVVPYKEKIIDNKEHINSYDESYFNEICKCDYNIFISKGWSQFGFDLWFNIYLKNLARPFLGKKLADRSKQIIYHFKAINKIKNKH